MPQLVQRRAVGIGPGIPADHVQVADRYVQVAAFGIAEFQKFLGLSVQLERFQALVAANAVIEVNDGAAWVQFG